MKLTSSFGGDEMHGLETKDRILLNAGETVWTDLYGCLRKL